MDATSSCSQKYVNMINWLHSRIYRPENGWDPISVSHAQQYTTSEWSAGVAIELIDVLESWCGGLSGKAILDLGGGPGQYSIAFAKRGAQVTWYDVSARYRTIAAQKALAHGVSVRFKVGYLDEAADVLANGFDLVFNRLCWYYGRGDRSFSKIVYELVKPGGIGYVDTTHDRYMHETLSTPARIRTELNKYTGWKMGHPYPPHGRLQELFARFPMEKIFVDYSAPMNDRILFKKPILRQGH